MNNPELFKADLEFLHEMGAHFVLCAHDKRAVKKGWNKHRPSVKDCLRHRGMLGIIPASLGLFVIDVDEGNPAHIEVLFDEAEVPYRKVKTPNGWHIYCYAPEGQDWKGNAKWDFAGCKGDIRYDAGYVCVYDDFDMMTEFVDAEPIPCTASILIQLLNKPSPRGKGPVEGNRNNWLFGAVKDAMKAGDTAAASDAAAKALDAGLSDKEVAATVMSAAKSAGTVRKQANDRIIVEGKSERGLEQALIGLGLDWRFDIRSEFPQIHYDSRWHNMSDRMARFIIRRIYERVAVRTFRKGGFIEEPWRLSKDAFAGYLDALCFTRERDSFLEWIKSLPPWDKVQRIDNALYDCFEVDESPLVGWCAKYLFMAPIQRALDPGCRLDEIPVLIGAQDLGKSRLVEYLFPRANRWWYGNGLDMNQQRKERVESLLMRVVIEWSEMVGLKPSSWEAIKQFITQTDDGQVRLAYARYPTYSPRRVVIVATTNNDKVLPNDPSGNRRFVPVYLKASRGPIETWLDERREQLFAEALARYDLGERANLDRGLKAKQAEAADMYRYSDELEQAIIEAEFEGVKLTLDGIAALLELEWDRPLSKSHQSRLSLALKQCGFQSKREVKDGKRRHVWIKS